MNNLGFGVTQSDLRKEFQFVGSITEICLQRRIDGASKGRAYIQFATDEDVDRAITRHMQPIRARVAWVRHSRPPARRGGAAQRPGWRSRKGEETGGGRCGWRGGGPQGGRDAGRGEGAGGVTKDVSGGLATLHVVQTFEMVEDGAFLLVGRLWAACDAFGEGA